MRRLLARPDRLRRLGEQLVDGDAARILGRRFERHQDEQRHQHGARPIGDLVEMKRKPLRQQHDLDRHHRHAAPRQHAVEREQRACEYVRARRAAARQNGLARASHVGRLRIVAEIRLHARAHVERAVVKERPAAVRALDATQILRDLGLEHGIDRLAAVMPQQDIFGGNRGVGFQLEHPMPVGLLAIEQRRRRMRDAAIERVVGLAWGSRCHGCGH